MHNVHSYITLTSTLQVSLTQSLHSPSATPHIVVKAHPHGILGPTKPLTSKT